MEILNIVKEIAKSIDDKKGEEIKVLDLRGITEIADFFVIATGRNTANIRSICDNIEEQTEKLGYGFIRKQGYDEADWIILDYGDVVVHLLKEEARKYYDLEKFWRSAKTIEVEI